MRKLRIFEHISLDGVIQQTADGGDFPYIDWTVPYRTPAGRDALLAMYGERFDLLLGRRTYDLWSGFWPTAPASPWSERINGAMKYVATHRPESLRWGPVRGLSEPQASGESSSDLGTDVSDSSFRLAEDVRRLKSTDGPDLILSGSSTLTSALLEHGLADEVVLIVYPVLLGTGKRLFAEGTPAQAFELVSSQTFPSGVVISAYKMAGPLQAS